MKRILLTVSVLLIVLAAAGCISEPAEKPLTMNIELGTNVEINLALIDLVKQDLGIEIVPQQVLSRDTSGYYKLRAANDDLPDIILTAQLFDADVMEERLVDLVNYDVLRYFMPKLIHDASSGGHLYQVPITERLCGISYNKNILAENGWEVPESLEDLKALIPKIKAAGYQVSSVPTGLTGCGFLNFFYFAGAEYLSRPSGADWVRDFTSGNTDRISDLGGAADYFEELIDIGFISGASAGSSESNFKKYRDTVFYIYMLPVSPSYDGYQYTRDGLVVDAVYEEDAAGEYVMSGSKYEVYSADNPNHAGKTRYRVVSGKMLHDEYGNMPWISGDGANNCYVELQGMYVALNRHLLEKGNEERLSDALSVIEYMATSEEFAKLITDTYAEAYLPLKSFEITPDRSYYDYRESVERGFLMPWYYKYFTENVIVNFGDAVNHWEMQDGTMDKAGALKILKDEQDKSSAAGGKTVSEVYAQVPRTLSVADTAKFAARAMARYAGADAGLMPYNEDITVYDGYIDRTILHSRLYEGDYTALTAATIMPQLTASQVFNGVYLTGAELKRFAEEGMQKADEPVSHSMMAVTADGSVFADDKVYLTAVIGQALPPEFVSEKAAEGKVVAWGYPLGKAYDEYAKALGVISV
ncbi:MAG TPA: ABC transporter substrate-binding protein [Methanocorpusculum sp.]|nr:ABC transporter substrate-binding protein [Methanocorpusculum sp.]